MELDVDNLDPLDAAGWMLEHGMLQRRHHAAPATRRQPLPARQRRGRSKLGVPTELLEQLQPWVVGMELLEMQYLQLGFEPSRASSSN